MDQTIEKQLSNGVPVPAEFFSVNCELLKGFGGSFYSVYGGVKSYFTQISENIRENFNSFSESINIKREPLSIVILAFDSISNAAFHRFLPSTERFLKNELNAAIFEKYTILGDGTPPGKEFPISSR